MSVAVGVSTITKEQEKKILDLAEGHFADLKAKEIKPAKLTKAIAAFANADGGELYIGVGEQIRGVSRVRSWDGFAATEDANAHLQVFEGLFPLGQDFSYTFLSSPGSTGFVLHVLVHKTRDIKKASDGVVYLRRGAQSLPVDSPDKLRRLELDKGITSFESDTVGVDVRLVSNSETMIRFMLEVIPTSEPEAWLRKQLLIVSGKPTVAAALLYADEPQAILPKRCGLKLYRYATRDQSGSRETLTGQPATVEGCIYSQIKEAVRQTVELIQTLSVLDDQGNVKAVVYPPETLHEIITNAMLHRDYSIADDVHVRIFENRIEVESPGRLPGHITADNILDERFARNGQVVRLINKFPDPPNKDVGEGLNTAFEAMRRLELKDPIIEERTNSVLVTIRHERVDPPEVLILKYLETHTQVTNKEARELCHIGSENKVKRIFEKMMEKNLIERVPGLLSNKTAYRKTAKAKKS
jgi:ATP-dependent DNA helicase RecG